MLISTTTYTSTPGLPEPEGPADDVGHDEGGGEPLELIYSSMPSFVRYCSE